MPEINSRYSRQILFGEIGESGQQRLAESLVVILGCGALGHCSGRGAVPGRCGQAAHHRSGFR